MDTGQAIEDNSKKIIITLSIIIGVLLIFISVFAIIIPFINSQATSTYLDIAVAPSTATIELDGTKINAGVNEITPGEHHLKFSAPNFESKEINIIIEKHKDQSVVEYLKNTTEGMRYFFKSREDIAVLRSYQQNNTNDQEVTDFLNKYDSLIKITEKLPIVTNFREGANIVSGEITDGTNNPKCDYAFCLQVDQSKSYEWRVRESMQLAGYNYDDYEIIYEN